MRKWGLRNKGEGEWRMCNGEWRLENGEWKMGSENEE